jgi:hypothetical protein
VLNIASIIKLFLTLASSLAQYAHDKKMMEAGAAMAVVLLPVMLLLMLISYQLKKMI